MEKIKQFVESEKGKDILVIIIIILVGLGSFGLGRLSKNGSNNGIKVEYKGQEANVVDALKVENGNPSDSSLNSKGNFFASKRGSKYYTISCSAGKTIKQENRVYFSTSSEAEGAGYTLSSSCQ